MRPPEWIPESQFLLAYQAGLAERRADQSDKRSPGRKAHRTPLLVLVTAIMMAALSVQARSQSLDSSGDSSALTGITAPEKLHPAYLRPTQKTKISNYVLAAFGPRPIVISAVSAGINQETNTPPDWNQGAEGYAKRFGSNYGILAVGSTTHYALSEVFKEDAMYYRCECRGVFPRIRHALLSTFTARRGEDGHQVFSIPALVAPYVGSTIAVYGWYPARYGPKDAFRMGNYDLLEYMAGNISLEFLYSGPRSLLHRVHMNNTHGSPEPGPNP